MKDIFKEIYLYILFCGGNSAASKALRKIDLVAFYHEFYCPGFHHHLKDKGVRISKKFLLFLHFLHPIVLHTYPGHFWNPIQPTAVHFCTFLNGIKNM